jgi:hypothetical protein
MSAEEQMQTAGASEAGRKMMDEWMKWFQTAGSSIVDGGSPLGRNMHVTKTGTTAHSGDYIGGYSIVHAEDMDKAKAMFSNHPHFMQDGNTIEMLEMLLMPGM